MLFNQMTYIGIDPTAGQRPFSYAALDQERRPVAISEGHLDEVLAFAAGQQQAVVAVCSPRHPNRGVMAKREIRQSLTPQPSSGSWMDFRVADYLIRQHKIIIPQTYSREEACPQWMQNGFHLYRQLESYGYEVYSPGNNLDDYPLQIMEVYPHACFTVLLGVLPFAKHTLEGRIQRQLVLLENEVKVPDPMTLFDEFTPHNLLHGILPLKFLNKSEELDAVVAAYTAWVAINQAAQFSLVGDVDEGQIGLPGLLKEKY